MLFRSGLHNFLEKKKKREQCSLKKSTASVKARLSFSPSTCTVKLTKEKKRDVFFLLCLSFFCFLFDVLFLFFRSDQYVLF